MGIITKIFAIRLTEPINNEKFQYLIQYVCEEKKRQILGCRTKKDADLMLIGNILARYAINSVFGIKLSDIKFLVGKYGKPYVKGYDNIHFNISHSGDYAVCVVSDVSVGIDIQKIEDIDFTCISQRYFSKNEAKRIQNAKDKQTKFYEIWTKKESYLKMLGRGFACGTDCDYQNCTIEKYDCFDGYIMSVSKAKG